MVDGKKEPFKVWISRMKWADKWETKKNYQRLNQRGYQSRQEIVSVNKVVDQRVTDTVTTKFNGNNIVGSVVVELNGGSWSRTDGARSLSICTWYLSNIIEELLEEIMNLPGRL